MWTPARLRQLPPPAILLIAFLTITAIDGSFINGSKSRKLAEIKCGGCPCTTPCTTPYYPPPPPPPPSPPPPPPPPPSPPPPVKPPPSTGYCPPPPYYPRSPPSPEIIYITGPPGSLYPVDQTYGQAVGRSSLVALVSAVSGGLVALLLMW